MVDDTINSMALLRFFSTKCPYSDLDTQYRYGTNETLKNAPITRDENENMVMTFPVWNEWTTPDEEFYTHPFAGLIRFPEQTGNLHNKAVSDCKDGNVVYTIDNNYRLKAIEAEIYVDASSYNLDVEIEFSDYNNVLPLNIPAYTTVQPTTAE